MSSEATGTPSTTQSRRPIVTSRTIVTVTGIAGLVILAWRDPTLAPEVVTGLLGIVGFHHLSSASG